LHGYYSIFPRSKYLRAFLLWNLECLASSSCLPFLHLLLLLCPFPTLAPPPVYIFYTYSNSSVHFSPLLLLFTFSHVFSSYSLHFPPPTPPPVYISHPLLLLLFTFPTPFSSSCLHFSTYFSFCLNLFIFPNPLLLLFKLPTTMPPPL
jgi:hypothetical protein